MIYDAYNALDNGLISDNFRQVGFFFVYSLLACDLSDHGEVIYSPFPVRCPLSGARCKRPFALCPGLSQEVVTRTKGITKERRANTKDKGKKRQGRLVPLRRSCQRHEVGHGEEQWSPPAPASSAPPSLLVPATPAPPAPTPHWVRRRK